MLDTSYTNFINNYTSKENNTLDFGIDLKTSYSTNITIEDWNTLQTYVSNLNSDSNTFYQAIVDIYNYLKNYEDNIKDYVDARLQNKLDKNLTPNTLYGVDENGNQQNFTFSYEPLGFNIPNRDINGQLKVVNTPTESFHATSKYYVDLKVAEVYSGGFTFENPISIGYGNTLPTMMFNVGIGTGPEDIKNGFSVLKNGAIVFGIGNGATGDYSFANGYYTVASGYYAHSEGNNTVASGDGSYSAGYHTTSSGCWSHAIGTYTTASGEVSFASGRGTIASARWQTAMGWYNTENSDAIVIIGAGTSRTNRFNALEVTKTGYVKVYKEPVQDVDVVRKIDLINKIAELVGTAPEALNTLYELAKAINDHESEYDALLAMVGSKANQSDVNAALNGKVNKLSNTSGYTLIYANNPNGIDTFMNVRSSDGTAASIVARDTNGYIKVTQTPIDDTHAVNKKWVEDFVAQYVAENAPTTTSSGVVYNDYY